MLLQIMIGFTLLQNIFRLPLISIGILDIDLSRLLPGIIVISLNSGAYVAEIVRGGINAMDYGQTEAAGPLGLRPLQTMLRGLAPGVAGNILPPRQNEFIALIKDSSLPRLSHLRLDDSAQIVISSSFNFGAIFDCGANLFAFDVYHLQIAQSLGATLRQRLSSLGGKIWSHSFK